MEYATGIGVEGTYANFRVLCQNIQVDDQSPFTRYNPSLRHCADYQHVCTNIPLHAQPSPVELTPCNPLEFCPICRYPVVLAATEEEIVTGEEANPEIEPPPVVSFSVVSQPGLPRRQVYYPYIAWRLSRTLQVHTQAQSS